MYDAGNGTAPFALASGGYTTTAVANTEEFTANLANKTITAS